MLGIAFEGCACRAAFHAGVAAALTEAGLPLRVAAGTSSGAVCAVAIAAGLGPSLPQLWRALAGRPVLALHRAHVNRSPFDMSTILRRAVTDAIGGLDLRARDVEAVVVATALRGLRPRVYSSRTEASMIEPVLGSCFLPVIYGRPVRHRGEVIVDGGLVDNLPVGLAVERGATEVIAVTPAADGHAFKSLRARRWRPAFAGARVHVVHPRRPLAIKSWDFATDRMEAALEEGWHAGRRLLGT